MFNIGDLLIYSTHGICKVNDIEEKTIAGVTRNYYVLQPVENDHNLTISAPVDNKKMLHELVDKEEAFAILESFKEPGVEWKDNANVRFNSYNKLVNSGERQDIADVVNTLMRKENEYAAIERQLYQRDEKLLIDTQNILFRELAISLDTTFEKINQTVEEAIQANAA